MSREKKQASVNQDRQRLVKKRRASKGDSGADVHGISHETVRPANHESARRIERRRSAFTDECKSEHTPKRNRRTDRPNNHLSDLRRSNDRGPDNARPSQEATG